MHRQADTVTASTRIISDTYHDAMIGSWVAPNCMGSREFLCLPCEQHLVKRTRKIGPEMQHGDPYCLRQTQPDSWK